MDAAGGVIHAEMPSEELMKHGGTMEGFQVRHGRPCAHLAPRTLPLHHLYAQIWVNLPAAAKRGPPRYQDVSPDTIPTAAIPSATGAATGSHMRVIAGVGVGGVKGPVETTTPILYWDVRLAPGDTVTAPVPHGWTVLAYVFRGSGVFGQGAGGKRASEGAMVVFKAAGDGVSVTADVASTSGSSGGGDGGTRSSDPADLSSPGLKFLLLGGAPIGEPIVSYGPFVMNTMAEIETAFDEYRSGRLGRIDGAEER